MPNSRVLTAADLDPVVGANAARAQRVTTAATLFSDPLVPIATVAGVMLLTVLAISTARTAGLVAVGHARDGDDRRRHLLHEPGRGAREDARVGPARARSCLWVHFLER